MDLESKSVYDFFKGGFVHRLLHNAVDGKMVELSKNGNGKYEISDCKARLKQNLFKSSEKNDSIEKKVEMISEEYSSLLSQQVIALKSFSQSDNNDKF